MGNHGLSVRDCVTGYVSALMSRTSSRSLCLCSLDLCIYHNNGNAVQLIPGLAKYVNTNFTSFGGMRAVCSVVCSVKECNGIKQRLDLCQHSGIFYRVNSYVFNCVFIGTISAF